MTSTIVSSTQTMIRSDQQQRTIRNYQLVDPLIRNDDQQQQHLVSAQIDQSCIYEHVETTMCEQQFYSMTNIDNDHKEEADTAVEITKDRNSLQSDNYQQTSSMVGKNDEMVQSTSYKKITTTMMHSETQHRSLGANGHLFLSEIRAGKRDIRSSSAAVGARRSIYGANRNNAKISHNSLFAPRQLALLNYRNTIENSN